MNEDIKTGTYTLEREESEINLKLDCSKYIYYPDLESNEMWMSKVMSILIEVGHVTTLTFSADRNYVYPFEQVKLLNEIRDVYIHLTKEKRITSFYLAKTPTKETAARHAIFGRIVEDLLKKDPIGAYVETIREVRKQKILMNSESNAEKAEGYSEFIKLLEYIENVLEKTMLIQMVEKKLAGYEIGDRSLYREIFEPMIKPNFMYTRLMAEPPMRGEEIDHYRLKGNIDVAIYQVPDKISYMYHILPEEYKLNEEEYIILNKAREVLVKYKPEAREFVDPSRMRDVFTNIAHDLVEQISRAEQIKLTYTTIKKLAKILVRLTVGFGLIEVLLLDDKIEDIYVNAPVGKVNIIVKHAEYGECITNIVANIKDADSWASRFRMLSGRPLDEANPILDTELILPEIARARVAIIQEPLSTFGLSYAFRRHREKPWTLPLFIKSKMISPIAAGVMSFLIDGNRSMLIAGTRGTGKSSFLGSMMTEILRTHRIITIEDSVTGDMQLFSEINRKMDVSTVEEMFNYLSKKYKFQKINGREILNKNPENIKVYSMNAKGKLKLSRVSKFIRHKVNKAIYSVTTATGREISVTQDHSLFTINKDKPFSEIKAAELKLGDYIVTPLSLPLNGKTKQYRNSLQYLKENDKIFVYCKGFRNHLNNVKDQGMKKGYSKSMINKWIRDNFLPLEVYNSLKKKPVVTMFKCKGNSIEPLPINVKLDDKFLELLGLWIADGCYDRNSVVFSVVSNEERKLVKDIAERFGLETHMHSDKVSLQIHSKTLKYLFEKVCYLRGDAYTKRIPCWVYNLSRSQRSSFLKGVFSGDGCVSDKEIIISLASKELLKGLQTILLSYGIIFRINSLRERKFHDNDRTKDGRISALKFLKIFKDEIGFIQKSNNDKLAKLCRRISTHDSTDIIPLPLSVMERINNLVKKRSVFSYFDYIRRENRIGREKLKTVLPYIKKDRTLYTYLQSLVNSDIYWDKIVKITKNEKKQYVYDFSVPGNENFVCSSILAHNTLELPTTYLRDLNFNIIPMKVRSALSSESGELSSEDGVRTALRLGDSCLIMGEIRSKEAISLYEAMRVGAMANVVAGTIHADSPYGIFDRVVNDLGVPTTSFKATDIAIIATKVRSPSGMEELRRVVDISEVRKHWSDDPVKEQGFFRLMDYDAKRDMLVPTPQLMEGESEVIKSIASRVKAWVGEWDKVWENIILRAKVKKMILDYAEKSGNNAVLESDFTVVANDQFHRIIDSVTTDIGYPEPKDVLREYELWIKSKVKAMRVNTEDDTTIGE